MALPPYTSKDELDASGAPVVPLEPVAAVAPNRGTENVASSLDYLAALQRVHQTLSFGTAPRMEWDDASRVLTLGGDLVVRYVVDDPTSTLPVIRSTTLKSGSYSFGTNTMVFVPLGFDADVLITAGGTVVPPSAGSLAYFKDDGEAQQFFRADTSANGRQNAFKYIQFARKVGTSMQVLGRVVLRSGAPVEDFRDEEYAGDTVTQQTRRYINQDRNLMMYGAGEATFSSTGSSVRLVRTTQDLELVTTNGTRTTVTGLVVGVKLTATNPVLAVSLNRTLGSVVAKPATATNFSALSSDNTDLTMLGFWDATQDVFRWRDGSGYKPGTSHTIGLCCDFTPSFLIERILPEIVFATDAAAHASLDALLSTNRVAFVVDNGAAPSRDRIRLVTQDSIRTSGPAGAASETLRAAGVEVTTVYAAGTVSAGVTQLRVLDAIGADKARVEAALVGTLRLVDYQSTGAIEVTEADGVTPGNLSANFLIANRLLTSEVRAAAGDTVTFTNSSGADFAVVASRYAHVDTIRGTQSTLRIENASALGTLHPLEASQGLFSQFVRVDGTGLSEPQIRAAGSEVAFRDAAGGPVVDVRAKDVRAHDLRLFDDATVTGSWGDLRVQAQAPNSYVPAENALVVSTALLIPTPVCLRVTSLGDLGAVEVGNIRTHIATSYVRVRNHVNDDERDIWARDLYLNSTGAGAGAIYFSEPSAASPKPRLSSASGRLEWREDTTDVLRDIAVQTLFFADPNTAPVNTLVGAQLRAATQTYRSESGITPAPELRVISAGSGILEARAVAASNTACLTGCMSHLGFWRVDTLAPGDVAQRPFRPSAVATATWGTDPVIKVTHPSPAVFESSLSWTYSAQYYDGTAWYPVTAALVGVVSTPPVQEYYFRFWYAASGHAVAGGGTSVTGDPLSTSADVEKVRFVVHMHTPEDTA